MSCTGAFQATGLCFSRARQWSRYLCLYVQRPQHVLNKIDRDLKRTFSEIAVIFVRFNNHTQAMPATGLGPSSMGHPGLSGSQGAAGLPGGPPGPGGGGGGGPLPISIPPQYSQTSYHPSYMQQVSLVKFLSVEMC